LFAIRKNIQSTSSFLDVFFATFPKFLPESISALLCPRLQIGHRDYRERGGSSNKLGTRNASYASRNAFCVTPLSALPHRYYESFGIPIPVTSVCTLLRNCFAIVCDYGPFEFTVPPITNAPTNDRSITERVRDLMRLSSTEIYSDCTFNREIYIRNIFLESRFNEFENILFFLTFMM